MKSGFMDDLQITEGRIRGLVVTDDAVEFIVGQSRAHLRKSRVTMALRDGDHVNLVLGDSLFGQHAILAVHRGTDGITQYVGPIIGPKCILLSAVVFAGAMWMESMWLLILAIAPLIALQTVFVRDKKRVLTYLKNHAQRLFTPPAEDIPLTLPARSADWPAHILDFTNDAIIIWEMEGAGIVYWNRAAERIYGYSREEALGKVTHDLLETQIEGGTHELEARLERFGVWIGALRHRRSDGQVLEIEGRLSLMAQAHRPWLVLEVNRDVTDHKRAEAEREKAVQQLRRLRSLAPVRPAE